MNTARLAELTEAPDHGLASDGMRISMGGMLTEVRQKATRSGSLMGFATLEDLTGAIEMLVFPKVLERVATELMPDTAVIVTGRLSIREDEDPKLLLDEIEPLPTNAEAEEQAKRAGVAPQAIPSAPRPAPDEVLPGSTLYLRLPSDGAIPMVTPLLERSGGPIGVVLYIEATGKKLRAPASMNVTPTKKLIGALRDMLGAKNVVLK